MQPRKQSGSEEERASSEQQHVALAGRLGDGSCDARGSRHAPVVAAKLHRAHEAAPAHVDDGVLVCQLHQSLHMQSTRAQISSSCPSSAGVKRRAEPASSCHSCPMSWHSYVPVTRL